MDDSLKNSSDLSGRKRSADTELTRDNFDQGESEEKGRTTASGFEEASAEVLAKRKIRNLGSRRRGAVSSNAPTVKFPSLVAPKSAPVVADPPAPKQTAALGKNEEGKEKEPEKVEKVQEEKEKETKTEEAPSAKPKPIGFSFLGNKSAPSFVAKPADPSGEKPKFSFGKPSFKTSGFSKSTTAAVSEAPKFPSLKTTFKFGTTSAVVKKDEGEADEEDTVEREVEIAPGSGVAKLEKKDVKTGEEGEENLVTARAKLYEFGEIDGRKKWLERGVGDIHVNETEAAKCHLIMRVEKIGKVILNVCLKKPTSVRMLDERKMQFQAVNFVGDADVTPRVYMVVFSKSADAKSAEEHIKRIVSE